MTNHVSRFKPSPPRVPLAALAVQFIFDGVHEAALFGLGDLQR